MIYDITRELLSAQVYPGDPVPSIETVLSLHKAEPDICQLSKLTMGTHSGTHIDAPAHFCRDGKTAKDITLNKCLGRCNVVTFSGQVEKKDIDKWTSNGFNKLLLHGKVEIIADVAKYMVHKGIVCVGVEMATIAVGEEQVKVHQILLEAEVVILESINLKSVPDGSYFLSALPLKIANVDGTPVRAVLYTDLD